MRAVALRRCGVLAMATALLFVSGCGADSTPEATMSPTTTTDGSSAPAAKEMDAGVADRLDEAIEKTMSMADSPARLWACGGPTATT